VRNKIKFINGPVTHNFPVNKLFRLNVEGELSHGEHVFVSDRDIVKKMFAIDYQGVWNPVGEWEYDPVCVQNKRNSKSYGFLYSIKKRNK
jgi:hypothetical protein